VGLHRERIRVLETEVIGAIVSQRCDLSLASGSRVELDPGIMLQPRHGFRMRTIGTSIVRP
jgi:hypothetical protein